MRLNWNQPPIVDQANAAITGGSITGTNVPYNVSKSAIAFVKMPSGTMGNNGAVSALTALPRAYTGGCWAWFPAGAVAAGVPAAASWLWFVASSTTAGTVFNSTYTSGTPTLGTQTAFATTGPGAFTGDTGTVTAVSFSLPANSLGPNGRFEVHGGCSFTNTAGNKTATAKFGASQIWGATLTTVPSAVFQGTAQNAGVTNIQRSHYVYDVSTNSANGTVALVDATVDTTAAVACSVTLAATTAATDWAILENYVMRVEFGA